MTRKLFVITGLLSLLAAQATSAQPRWGRERMPDRGVCFYEDKDFKGRYFCLRAGDRLTEVPNGIGDEISSIRMRGNAEVLVFRDSNLRGRSARFIGNVRDLKREGWNDQISSVDVGDSRDYSRWTPGYDQENGRDRAQPRGTSGNYTDWRSDRPPVWGRSQDMPEGACFYKDAGFRGESFCIPRGGTYSSLPSGFNDRISSVRVFDGTVVVFSDSNYRGRSQQLRSDVRDLRGNWKDRVSSIRVY